MLSLTVERQSWAHPIPVGWKLLALMVLTTVVFQFESLRLSAAGLVALLPLYATLGRKGLQQGLSMLRPLAFMCALIFAYHLATQDILGGATVVLRILLLVGLANFVTMTSRLSDMQALVARLLRPFARLGLPVTAVSLSFALVVRFTPVLLSRGSALIDAWRARSSRRASWKIAVPMVLLALDDADRVSDALRARGMVEKGTRD